MNFEELTTRVKKGTDVFINNVKLLVYKADPELFSLLDFDDDATFMEPLLFNYFNSRDRRLPLSQILFGYTPPARRPETIEAYADDQGRIYLPGHGYYRVDARDSRVTLQLSTAQGFEPLLLLPGTDIEICRHTNPLTTVLFKTKEDLQVEKALASALTETITACNTLAHYFPEFFTLFRATTRRLFLFCSDTERSFATMLENGTAFFNIRPGDDEVSIIEDITHQCGHIILYSLVYDKQAYFSVPLDTPMKQYNGKEHETRSVLGALYSMMPYLMGNLCSSRIYDKHLYPEEKQHELMGRFAYRLHKFDVSLSDFRSGEMLTPKGMALIREFDEVYQTLYKQFSPILADYHISTQVYGFSRDIFIDRNPLITSKTVL